MIETADYSVYYSDRIYVVIPTESRGFVYLLSDDAFMQLEYQQYAIKAIGRDLRHGNLFARTDLFSDLSEQDKIFYAKVYKTAEELNSSEFKKEGNAAYRDDFIRKIVLSLFTESISDGAKENNIKDLLKVDVLVKTNGIFYEKYDISLQDLADRFYGFVHKSDVIYSKLADVLADNRQDMIKNCIPGEKLSLEKKEANNKIEVAAYKKSQIIGFLRWGITDDIIERMNQGEKIECFARKVTGGDSGKHLGLNIRIVCKEG